MYFNFISKTKKSMKRTFKKIIGWGIFNKQLDILTDLYLDNSHSKLAAFRRKKHYTEIGKPATIKKVMIEVEIVDDPISYELDHEWEEI